jgi:protein DGCR14
MPPPPPKPRSKRPAALDEDTFVAAMGEIIERDFFPDLPKLQRQLKWLEGVEKRRVHTLSEVHPPTCPRAMLH